MYWQDKLEEKKKKKNYHESPSIADTSNFEHFGVNFVNRGLNFIENLSGLKDSLYPLNSKYI